ncbi:hypothetical protein FRB96_004124 [Tulasnella sp. 330]|nr:hypothetical protein FRB96_004124 [Tulasnella sp. 330]KAG8876652.1 hypothetical protein FRB97_004017 [Tulasnella sp. 331]
MVQDGGPISTIDALAGVKTLSVTAGDAPKGWRTCIHPEGDTYFCHDEKRIVTTSDPRDQSILESLLKSHDQLKRLLYATARDLLSHSELYLNVGRESSGDIPVHYYWADHLTSQIFWCEDVPCAALGFPDFGSRGEIKSRLTPEYWTHVEYFPVHLPVKPESEDEIIGIFRHGCIDDKTSPGSTFPFSEAESLQYLRVLEGFKSTLSSAGIIQGYRNAVIARLWNAIARARHINRYGLDSPRLDRLQGLALFTESQMKDSKILRVAELLCGGLSRVVFVRLTSMWNGRVVYQRHWQAFFQDMRGDWAQVASAVRFLAGLLRAGVKDADGDGMGSTVLLASGVTSLPVLASIAFSGASVFISSALCHRHRTETLATGPDVSKYIMSVENYYHGLRPLSIVYVIPHALTVYSAISFTAAVLLLAFQRAKNVKDIVSAVASLSIAVLPIIGTLAYFNVNLFSLLSVISGVFQPFKGLAKIWEKNKAQNNDRKMD